MYSGWGTQTISHWLCAKLTGGPIEASAKGEWDETPKLSGGDRGLDTGKSRRTNGIWTGSRTPAQIVNSR